MQNKARLELADYEAVGTLLLEFNAGGVGRSFPANLMFLFCALGSSVTVSFVSCQNCGKARPEATSGAQLGDVPGFATSQSICCTASPPGLGQITQKFTLVSCSQLTVPRLYSRY